MGLTIEFTIPPPPRELSPNRAYEHWRVRSKARREYRLECRYYALSIRTARVANGLPSPTLHRATIAYEWVRKQAPGRYLPNDYDNALASLKAAQDAFVDAGLVTADGFKHCRPSIEFVKARKGDRPEIRVRITEEE